MLTCIDGKFIFDSVRLGLSSSVNILQNPVFAMFLAIILPSFSCSYLTFEMIVVSAIFVFTTKTTQPHPQFFSVTVP